MMKAKLACLLLIAVLVADVLHAHPHMFVESRVVIVFDQRGLAGFQMEWVFDEISGSGYIMDYDTNGDAVFDQKELAVLKKEAFDNLKHYNYMLSATIEGRNFEIRYARDFFAKIDNGKLIYTFLVPCHVTAISNNKEVRLAIYDEEFFVDFDLQKEIGFVDSSTIAYHYKVEKNLNKRYYFDQLHPVEIILNFRKIK